MTDQTTGPPRRTRATRRRSRSSDSPPRGWWIADRLEYDEVTEATFLVSGELRGLRVPRRTQNTPRSGGPSVSLELLGVTATIAGRRQPGTDPRLGLTQVELRQRGLVEIKESNTKGVLGAQVKQGARNTAEAIQRGEAFGLLSGITPSSWEEGKASRVAVRIVAEPVESQARAR